MVPSNANKHKKIAGVTNAGRIAGNITSTKSQFPNNRPFWQLLRVPLVRIGRLPIDKNIPKAVKRD
jgi:hypothetical protein